MALTLPERESAWNLLCEWTESDSLRKHALGVEAVMRAYAREFGEDEELWGLTGLLHDMDYERYPAKADHPFRGVEALGSLGYPDVMLEAILGHAAYTGVARTTRLAQALFAVDELSGFVVAVALVRPSKRIDEVSLSSVKKKLKDKSFAKGCDRAEIAQGADELGVAMDEHIGRVIAALSGAAGKLGL